MKNMLDDESGVFQVLINDEGQYSLWPHALETPRGWSVAFGPGSRSSCLEFVEQNWTDMRPRSLIANGDSFKCQNSE